MDYTLLRYLLDFVEAFQKEHASNNIEEFIIWLNNRLFSSTHQEESAMKDHAPFDELMIAYKLMYLSKDLKKQTKAVLLRSHVSSLDEYSFLVHLTFQESFRKMELIKMHNLEAPTGIDIINRLQKRDLIEEFPDEEDRRSKRIRLTPQGIKEAEVLRPQIDAIFLKFVKPLSKIEKIQISEIFNKLL